MAGSDDSEKTEDPTPERRRKAREEGQFPRSKDLGAVVATGVILMGLIGFGDDLGAELKSFTDECLRNPSWLIQGDLFALGHRLGMTLAILTLPFAVCAAIAAIGAGLLEAGFQPHIELAAPKWNRLDLFSKLPQLFSPKQVGTNVLLSIGRVGAVGWVAYLVIIAYLPDLMKLSRTPVPGVVAELYHVAINFAIWATFTLLVLSAVDYVVSWFRHEKSIKMSRQEVKDEHHQQEGDPKLRARIRGRAREIANRGLLKLIRESDVVVTNPTHVAVALRYRAMEGAPVINAKGYDDVAQHIKRLAREHGITVVENKPLARALARRGRLGKTIPVELYAAVAEVLAFVYRTRQRKRSA